MDRDMPVAERAADETYEEPAIVVLGGIEKLTHGPAAGSIDSIFGGDGGFQTSVTEP